MTNNNYLRFDFFTNIVLRRVLFPGLFLLFAVFLSCRTGEAESPQELFARAGAAYRTGNLSEASSLLIQVLETDSLNPNAWYNLGTVRMDQGRFQESVSAYERVIQLDSSRVDALIGITGALTGAGRYGEALAAGSLSVQLNPHDGMAFNNYGMALMETGDYQSASNCFATALRRDPENPSILYNCGRMRMLAGDFQGALGFFQSATLIDPHHHGARLETARAYGLLQQHVEAERASAALLASFPDDMEAMEILSAALSAQGRYLEALDLLHEILNARPDNIRCALGAAECLYMLDDRDGALEQYRYFLSLLDDTAGTSEVRERIAELEMDLE